MTDNISKDLVKELRKRTGISIIKCKQALIESKANIELAIDNIRKLGLKIDSNKFSRSTSSGKISVKISNNNTIGLIIEINCETDFVAKNNIFQEFTETVINIALRESICDIFVLQNRMKKKCLALINKVGENIKINKFSVLTGDFLESYVHGLKIGVIVSSSRKINKNIIKHIAMHIAAKNPKYINIHDIPEDVINRERKIQTDIAMQLKKPKQFIEKIVSGRMEKFFNEVVLVKQDFIMDPDKNIGEILNEYCIKINDFVRFEIGNDY